MAKSEQAFCKLHNKMEPRRTELRHRIGGATPYENRGKGSKNPFDLALPKPQQEVQSPSRDTSVHPPPILQSHNEGLDDHFEPLSNYGHADIEPPPVSNSSWASLDLQLGLPDIGRDSESELDDLDPNIETGENNEEDLTWDDLEI
ncbi:hypothetical protein H0H92_008274, partial [Tricholoma furcatifolium]